MIVIMRSAILVLALAGGGLAACNTVEGAGQDIESTGQAIENSADAAKPGNN